MLSGSIEVLVLEGLPLFCPLLANDMVFMFDNKNSVTINLCYAFILIVYGMRFLNDLNMVVRSDTLKEQN